MPKQFRIGCIPGCLTAPIPDISKRVVVTFVGDLHARVNAGFHSNYQLPPCAVITDDAVRLLNYTLLHPLILKEWVST